MSNDMKCFDIMMSVIIEEERRAKQQEESEYDECPHLDTTIEYGDEFCNICGLVLNLTPNHVRAWGYNPGGAKYWEEKEAKLNLAMKKKHAKQLRKEIKAEIKLRKKNSKIKI